MEINLQRMGGKNQKFSDYRGKALLIVNTASECGYTPQYKNLEALYQKFKSRGFEVLGVPSNDFGQEEPGTNKQIQKFVKHKYGVTFPMFQKVPVKGRNKCPLYQYLTKESDERFQGEVEWNFTKFLTDPEGTVVARFEPEIDPLDHRVIEAIERVLPVK
jgi:glutathione peroxidase